MCKESLRRCRLCQRYGQQALEIGHLNTSMDHKGCWKYTPSPRAVPSPSAGQAPARHTMLTDDEVSNLGEFRESTSCRMVVDLEMLGFR